MKNSIIYAWAITLSLLPSIAQANMAETQTHCMPHKQSLEYTCQVTLLSHNEPVSNASMSVSADMPSMPMAHNMRQIRVSPVVGLAGQYEFILELEMVGQWRLVYNILTPFADRVHEPLVVGTHDKSKPHKTLHENSMQDHSRMPSKEHD